MTNEERRLKFQEIRRNLEESGLLTKKTEIKTEIDKTVDNF